MTPRYNASLQTIQKSDEINSAYHKLASKNHPDVGGDLSLMQETSEAHQEMLRNLTP